ncbi:hypothetical protein [Novipirellula artificiosorum]|uniref:Uncharacterized protein n=1 Tax=Novipirellula artificiosorum TaxID=2528016 RepID=A0A5C6DPV4_9BACT|nr:hypothetical protein [Novipirellula artificiosorum]TWU39313.1 hypothetical protein Poly41_21370 [Novipirellula artificiosorum]
MLTLNSGDARTASYTADIELFAGGLRVYAPGKSFEQNDPYEFGCSIHWINKQTVELKILPETIKPPVLYRQAICKALRELGVETLLWKRRTKKGERTVRLKTLTGRSAKAKTDTQGVTDVI